MRYDQSTIREVNARTDLGALIGQYVSLRKRGNDLVGLCPFHSEKTPSFHVHPDRGFFKCFGCDEGGDAIKFLQKLENLSFADALRQLAGKAGIELQAEDPRAARLRGEREVIYDLNRLAAAFFVQTFRSAAGAKARAYCAERGFSDATIEKFGIGYAPPQWEGLVHEFERQAVDLAPAARASLVKRGERGYYDFFRDRLMIPTYSTTGEVIAFGGRALGDDERKYVNTGGTPVYVKGQHLFGLNLARRPAQASRTLIVTEGYLDCIAMHQAGFDNAVAALGTSFTQEQAAELRKYADRVFLCFDGDTAGNNAATKAVDIASQVIADAGSSVRIVALPEGQDPDSFLRARGAAAFAALLEEAKPSLEFKLDPQIDGLRSGFESPAMIARRAEALIRKLAPREEWDRWRVYVAGRLKINVDDLRNSRFFADPANFGPRAGVGTPGSRHQSAHAEPLSFERDVLGAVLEEPALARTYAESIPPERFGNAVYRRLYETIVANAERLHETGDVFALFGDDQASLSVLAALGSRDRSSTVRYEDRSDRRAHLDLVVERLQLSDEQQRYQELSHQIDELVTAGEPVSDALRGEFDALVSKLKS